MREHAPRGSGRSAARLLRYGLVALLSVFVLLTIAAAHGSGALPDRAAPPYPWVDVLTTCGILAIQTVLLDRTLQPPDAMQSWRALVRPLLCGIALLPLSVLLFTANTPRYESMPGLFALTTTIGVLATMAVLALRTHLRRRGSQWSPRALWKG